MKLTPPIKDQRGFTLIELIAVMILLSVLVSIVAVKYYNTGLQDKAGYAVVIPELNARESLGWSQLKLAENYVSDALLMNHVGYDLSNGTWQERNENGGIFLCQGSALHLKRIPSTRARCARWERM